MFPSRPDNVVGAFPGRSRVSTPPAGTQMGHEQMAAIRDALGPNGNLLVWGLGNDSPFWNDATTGRVAFLEDDIPEAKAGTLWYDVIIDGLQHIALSDALFPNGKQYFETMDKNKKQAVVVVHNNYIIGHDAKKKRFQDNGLWHPGKV